MPLLVSCSSCSASYTTKLDLVDVAVNQPRCPLCGEDVAVTRVPGTSSGRFAREGSRDPAATA